MSNPYESPNYGFDPAPGAEFQRPKSIVPSSMVQQVRVVAILNAVQGGLEIVMALFWIAYAVILPVMMNNPEFEQQMNQQPDPPSENFMRGMTIILGVVGGVLLLLGVLRVVAGVRNWRFRGRMMGIASFALGALSVFSCYCAPTAIGVLVYGLIVYLNPSVTQAFAVGEEGMPGDRILFEFSPYRETQSMEHP